MSEESTRIALQSVRSELAAFEIEIAARQSAQRPPGIVLTEHRRKLVTAIHELEAVK